MNENLLPLYRQAVELAKNELRKKGGHMLARTHLVLDAPLYTWELWKKVDAIEKIENSKIANSRLLYIKERYVEIVNLAIISSYQRKNPKEDYRFLENKEFLQGYDKEVEESIILAKEKREYYETLYLETNLHNLTDFIRINVDEIIRRDEGKPAKESSSTEEIYHAIINHTIFYLMKMPEEKK